MMQRMDWKQIIDGLRGHGLTYQQIAAYAGMSKGGVHDLGRGNAKSVLYESGDKLVRLARSSVERRRARSAPPKTAQPVVAP